MICRAPLLHVSVTLFFLMGSELLLAKDSHFLSSIFFTAGLRSLGHRIWKCQGREELWHIMLSETGLLTVIWSLAL